MRLTLALRSDSSLKTIAGALLNPSPSLSLAASWPESIDNSTPLSTGTLHRTVAAAAQSLRSSLSHQEVRKHLHKEGRDVVGKSRNRRRSVRVKDNSLYTYGYDSRHSRTGHVILDECQLPPPPLARAHSPKGRLKNVLAYAGGSAETSPGSRARHNFSHHTTVVDDKANDADHALARKYLYLPRDVRERRLDTVSRVQSAIQKRFGNEYTVELFGSIRYGVSLPKSDLDLVIIDSKRNRGFEPNCTLSPIYDVRKLARALRQAGFTGVVSIPWAAVPIVKFRDPQTRLECDINVNERLGLFNSDLINAYCDASPLLRPMLLFIKLWAKPLGLNNPSPKPGESRSFSSYALALMTIGFLQTRGLLPNLQGNLPPLEPDVEGSAFWPRTRNPTLGPCDVRYHTEFHDWKPQQIASLRATVQDWFSYWCHEFRYAEQIISIRHGGLCDSAVREPPGSMDGLDSTEKPSSSARPRRIRVLDPFIETKNVAESISIRTLQRFVDECEAVTEDLQGGADLSLLVDRRPGKRSSSKAEGASLVIDDEHI
ncbi:putative RNA uridylyltransferase activity [Lyophyllum shimeji]|uniref:RNA uridylyltransferase activity n=1 Tax=Lyophyllum shimeji TaxID=47721 RepID=A0A9P3PS92_LYOSH|nr:putative RNA uridylyltransferase activity [Lyophyllum shimeji]